MTHVPDDELVSAVLDSEASAAEVAHVQQCDICQARLEQLRGSVAALSTPVRIPPAHVREAALAAAVHGPAEVRQTRSRPARRRGSWLSAAAVLIVALGIGGLALNQVGRGGPDSLRTDTALRDGTSQSSAAELATGTPDSPNAKTGGAAAGTSEADNAGGGAADTQLFSAAPVTDLGRVDDISVVSQRSSDDLTERDPGFATQTTLAPPCPPDSTDPILWQATLNYRGTDAVATVRSHGTAPDGATTRITEIRARAGCALLATQEFAPTTPQ